MACRRFSKRRSCSVSRLDLLRCLMLTEGLSATPRARDNLRARRVYSAPTDRRGAIADQRIALEGFYVVQDYPEHIRRIRFADPTTCQTLISLTNNTSLPATIIIAALYKTAGRSISSSNGSSSTCA